MVCQIHWVGRFELTGIACEIYFYSMLNGFVMSQESFTPRVELAMITEVCFEFFQMLLVHVISHGICRYFFVHGIVYAQMVNDLDIITTPSCFFLPSELSIFEHVYSQRLHLGKNAIVFSALVHCKHFCFCAWILSFVTWKSILSFPGLWSRVKWFRSVSLLQEKFWLNCDIFPHFSRSNN